MRNITVDDKNTTAIVYSPPLCNGTGWAENDQRGFSGSFRWCSGVFEPNATFAFTGVAIYYACPNFNGASMRFKLDDEPASKDVDLTSSAGRPSNWPNPSIVWYRTGLEYKEHTLQLLSGANNSRVNVDAFIYTVPDEVDLASLATSPTQSLTSRPAVAATPSSSPSKLSIGLGTTFAVIAFSIFLGIAYFLRKHHKNRLNRYSWKRPIPRLVSRDNPSSFEPRLTGQSTQTQEAVKVPIEDELIYPIRPPPVAPLSRHTPSDEYHDDSPPPHRALPRYTSPPHGSRPTPSHRGPSPYIARSSTYLSTSSRLEPNRRPTE